MQTRRGSLVRSALLCIWCMSFVCCSLSIFILYLQKRIEEDNLKNGLFQIYSTYSTYLAVLSGFYFNSRQSSSRTAQEQQVSSAFWIALGSSLVWNLVIVASLMMCWFGETIEWAIRTISYWGTVFSFLPALSLGLYLANPMAHYDQE